MGSYLQEEAKFHAGIYKHTLQLSSAETVQFSDFTKKFRSIE